LRSNQLELGHMLTDIFDSRLSKPNQERLQLA